MTALALILAVSFVSASPSPAPAPRPQQKVWLNEDVEALRANGGITEFFPVAETPAEAPAVEIAPLPQEKDPAWYLAQLDERRAELARLTAEMAAYRRFLASGAGSSSGLRLDISNVGITPQSSLWLLENRARSLRTELSDLEDLARRNSILPGLLR